MIAELEIRSNLVRFLSKEMSLDQLEDWLVQRSWNMHKDSGEEARKLASAIELRLAEYSSGHLDESGLRDELRSLGNTGIIQISFGKAVPIIAPEPPNNVTAEVRPQVLSFPIRWDPSQGAIASQGATVLVDTSRAVELA
jgi:hypothetical protein